MYGNIPFSFFLRIPRRRGGKKERKIEKEKKKEEKFHCESVAARFKGCAGLTIEMQITLCKQPPAEAQIFTDQVLPS